MNYHIHTTTGPNQYQVYIGPQQDGGGMIFGTDYVPVLQQRYPGRVFNRCYEWCSGPATIGFTLLDYGICRSLCLSDIFEPSIESVRLTVKENNLSNLVTGYVLDDVGNLPNTEKFDLVVANPPHFNIESGNDFHYTRINVDVDWQAHRNFYSNIKKYLTEDGIILLQENYQGSRPMNFEEMITQSGLQIKDSFFGNHGAPFYYIEVTHGV